MNTQSQCPVRTGALDMARVMNDTTASSVAAGNGVESSVPSSAPETSPLGMGTRRATLLAACVSGVVLVAGCSKAPQPVESPRPVIARIVDAASPVSGVAAYAGEVRARHENDLAFRIGGKVVARSVEVGSIVRRGQVLANLDPQDVQLQAESVRAQVAAAEAELVWSRAEFERYQALFAKQFVSRTVLDQKRHALDTSEAKLQQAKAQQSVSLNQSDYATLRADADGVITSLSIEPGQVVAAGQSVLRLARPDEKEVLINVPEGRVGELRAAKTLAVTLWTEPGKQFAGRVREIAPNADPATRTFATRVSILGANENVRLGMTANVVQAGHTTTRGHLVPLPAIGDRDGKPVLWIVNDTNSTVSPRPVTVAGWREDGAVVTDGLQGGERIVVVGVQKLHDGQKVRLASPDEIRTWAGPAPRSAAAGHPGAASVK